MPHRQPRMHAGGYPSSVILNRGLYDRPKKKKERSRALQFTYKLTAEELKVIETRPLFSQPMMYYLRK